MDRLSPALNCPVLPNVMNIWVGKLSAWCLCVALGSELMATDEYKMRLNTFIMQPTDGAEEESRKRLLKACSSSGVTSG